MKEKLVLTVALLSSPLALGLVSAGSPAIAFFLFSPDIVLSLLSAIVIGFITSNLILAL